MEEPVSLSATEIQGEFCTRNLVTTAGLKFLFVIDVTGSNLTTDPGRARRTAGMQALVNAYPEAKFALQTFSADSGNTYFVPFQGAAAFQTTLNTFKADSSRDSGGTPYGQTLQSVEANIRSYLTQQRALPRVERDKPGPVDVIFLSDGRPTDGIGTAAVDQLVRGIIGLPVAMNALDVVDEIVINSGLYGTQVSGPVELQQIATSGYGLFFDFSSGFLDFTKFRIPADRSPKAESIHLFATNLNVIWEKGKDGQVTLEADSDGDGLSDRSERSFQSAGKAPAQSEFRSDSDGNGLGDGVEALFFGTPCIKAGCATPTPVEDVRRLTSCDGISADFGGAGGHYAKDILNNCEKLVARADYKQFSTLSDRIPDGVKVRNGISPQDASLAQSGSQNGDMTALEKILFHLPWWHPDPARSGFVPVEYKLDFTGLRGGRSCYSFSIRNLPHRSLSVPPGGDPASARFNKIRVWLTQTDADLRDVLRVADLQLSASESVRIGDEDFGE